MSNFIMKTGKNQLNIVAYTLILGLGDRHFFNNIFRVFCTKQLTSNLHSTNWM